MSELVTAVEDDSGGKHRTMLVGRSKNVVIVINKIFKIFKPETGFAGTTYASRRGPSRASTGPTGHERMTMR
ncbi:hypothetical protein Areg01_75300 [Actinoplanes regularis]|nr:hypothetical protein Areg01_75300 [Actinoplanes regularis]